MNKTRTVARGLRAAAATAVLALSVPLAGTAWADGPGYGGTADQLNVTWTEPAAVAMAAPLPAADPPVVPGPSSDTRDPNTIGSTEVGPSLAVSGVGFRSQSKVVVQVGDKATEQRRTDVSGSLEMKVPADISAEMQPGASVLAVGTSPGGTRRTLVGSIPPKPSGVGPSDIIPWVGLVAVGIAAVLAVVRRRARAVADQPTAEGQSDPNSPSA
ncbi:MAG TPA: hypothetical protein PLB21_14700 [Actinomycetota bacterium]|nr:hypothetical protein [Actinomycetota bacterium]HQZ86858.1 hypothetical protein [Actinomycetota bacterium]